MYEAYLKRIFDIILSGLALIIFFFLLLFIAILIRLFDGPVFFTQERVGRNNSRFRLYKFRTLPVQTPNIASDQLKINSISFLGKVLRRTNLDELPQLWNILKGDMSIVGPRPAIPDQIELVTLRERNGASACKPGLTGYTQVRGYTGMSIDEKAAFDGKYAEQVTFWGDIVIILQTFKYLMKEPPVY